MNKSELVLAQIYDVFVIKEIELRFIRKRPHLRNFSLVRNTWHAVRIRSLRDARYAILSRILCQKSCFGFIFHLNDLPEVFLEDEVPICVYLRNRRFLKYNPIIDNFLRSSPVKLTVLCNVACATKESILVLLRLVRTFDTFAYQGVVAAIAIHALKHTLLVRVLWARLLGTHSLLFRCLRISIYISAESESYK